jgi:uncharacterized protein (TIGR02466 family)
MAAAMPNAPTWTPQFRRLWPTLIARAQLAGHEQHNPGLVALAERLDADTGQITARYQSVDVLAMDHDDVRWLRAGIDQVIERYLRGVGVDYGVRWDVRGWANINRHGDYHSPHNHGWSYLSGTYYVRVPQQPPEAGEAGAREPAAISFYDPRGSVNMLACDSEILSQHEFRVRPAGGTLLLWNSFLNHSVHPNMAQVTRVSISFNVALRWTDELAP